MLRKCCVNKTITVLFFSILQIRKNPTFNVKWSKILIYRELSHLTTNFTEKIRPSLCSTISCNLPQSPYQKFSWLQSLQIVISMSESLVFWTYMFHKTPVLIESLDKFWFTLTTLRLVLRSGNLLLCNLFCTITHLL